MDIPRLKTPLGTLIPGEPKRAMPKLKKLLGKEHPPRVVTVGDVVSAETLKAGIRVDLRIVDQATMRRPTGALSWKARKSYRVRNPAGVITQESWDTIKHAMNEDEVLIIVDGEEDLLTLPCIVESPDDAIVLYGQPNEGLVVVRTSPNVKDEARKIMQRATKEITS